MYMYYGIVCICRSELHMYDCTFMECGSLAQGLFCCAKQYKSICEQAMHGLALGVNTIITAYNQCVCNCCYGHVQLWVEMSFSLCSHCYLGGEERDALSCLGPVWYPVHVGCWRLQNVIMCSSLGVVLMRTCTCWLLHPHFLASCVGMIYWPLYLYMYMRTPVGSSGNMAWPLRLYMLGDYCCTAWLAVWFFFAGYWIDSGWHSYVQLCLYMSVAAATQSSG